MKDLEFDWSKSDEASVSKKKIFGCGDLNFLEDDGSEILESNLLDGEFFFLFPAK